MFDKNNPPKNIAKINKSQVEFLCLINIKLRIRVIQARVYKNKKGICTYFIRHIPRQKQRVNMGKKVNLFNYKIIFEYVIF